MQMGIPSPSGTAESSCCVATPWVGRYADRSELLALGQLNTCPEGIFCFHFALLSATVLCRASYPVAAPTPINLNTTTCT